MESRSSRFTLHEELPMHLIHHLNESVLSLLAQPLFTIQFPIQFKDKNAPAIVSASDKSRCLMEVLSCCYQQFRFGVRDTIGRGYAKSRGLADE